MSRPLLTPHEQKSALLQVGKHLTEPANTKIDTELDELPALDTMFSMALLLRSRAEAADVHPPSATTIVEAVLRALKIDPTEPVLATYLLRLETEWANAGDPETALTLRGAKRAGKTKRRRLNTPAQIKRRIAELTDQLAGGEITAADLRAQIYAMQTLTVLLRDQQQPEPVRPALGPGATDHADNHRHRGPRDGPSE